MGDDREYSYKVLVVGEASTGKTSIINRYVHNSFSEHYKTTLGVDFGLKVLHMDKKLIRLQLRDIAGQERAGSMTRVYYKDASGAFIVFDLTRPATFEAVKLWKPDIDNKVKLPDGSSLPVFLLASKSDLLDPAQFRGCADLDGFCRDYGFAGWHAVSAKENRNINEAMASLVESMMARSQPKKENDPTVFTPSAHDKPKGAGGKNKNGCC